MEKLAKCETTETTANHNENNNENQDTKLEEEEIKIEFGAFVPLLEKSII